MPKDKRKAPKPAVKLEPPAVRSGEVLGTMLSELVQLKGEVERYRLLVARLDAYEVEFPERAAHVRGFVTAAPTG